MKHKRINPLGTTLIIIVAIAALSFTIVKLLNESGTYPGTVPTTIQFKHSEIDMGQLKQGQPQTVSFAFQNTGTYPLVLQQVETSCGCTEPVWPKRPIKPGGTGEIKVTYDAKYPGRFVKSITVFCNTEKGMRKLVVKGEVAIDKNLK